MGNIKNSIRIIVNGVRNIDYYKILHHFTIGIDFLFAMFLLMSYLGDAISSWAGFIPYFFYFVVAINTLFFASKIKKIPEEDRDESSMIYYFSHFFLLSLVIIAVNQFLKRPWIISHLNYISALSVAFGFLTFYAYRDRVEREIEDERVSEERAEKKRLAEFDWKFPFLKRFDFSYGFERFWKERRFFMLFLAGVFCPFVFLGRLPYVLGRWGYGEGWWYSWGLVVIVVLGFVLRIRYIGRLQFWIDEANSVLVAKRISEGLGQTLMNGSLYSRAFIYHHYFGYLIDIFRNVNIHFLSRVINTPFLIITILIIYYFGKYIQNKSVGLGAAFLFCLSWISISMFREARFYEMWISVFITFILILYVALSMYFKDRNVSSFLSHNAHLLIILAIVGVVSYDSQMLTAFILYPLILLGVFLFLFQGDIQGIILSAGSLVVLTLALWYNYGRSFRFSNILKQTMGIHTTSGVTIFSVWNYMIGTGYGYLIIFLPIFISVFLAYRKKLNILFIYAFIISWYFIIAYQGFGPKMIRFYYPILPFLSIISSYCIFLFMKTYGKMKIIKYIVIIMIILLMTVSIRNSIVESNSILTRTSYNMFKNYNSESGLNVLKSRKDMDTSIIISDVTWSLDYYLKFGKLADFIVVDTQKRQFHKNKINPVANISEIDYQEIGKLNKSIYILFHYPSYRTSYQAKKEVERAGGKQIYRKGNQLIYYIRG